MDLYGCKCFYWSRVADDLPSAPEYFSLPASLPQWPPGDGFATGRLNLGEIDIIEISRFEFIWGSNPFHNKRKGVSFYNPTGIPSGFYIFGHYCQLDSKPLRGFVIAAREASPSKPSPALKTPVGYSLIWSCNVGNDEGREGPAYFWHPHPPVGYKSMGYLVTRTPREPGLGEVRCVRSDLTDTCENHLLMFRSNSRTPFEVWTTRPCHRGLMGRGVSMGTFFCGDWGVVDDELPVACLKNSNPVRRGMPDLDQIHAVINHYGPTVFFHPEEVYLPSSVPWFFKNGARVVRKGEEAGQPIDTGGSNLPSGGENDGEYWLDLPNDVRCDEVKRGDIGSAVLYVHVKPALGGAFTDVAMWVFCPFNGPATIKVGLVNIAFSRIGQHVGDWEHFTLRVSNFTGELRGAYFSQHSGGEWVDAADLEFVDGNKCAVYSSKSGHASFPRPGIYVQGSEMLGVGVRNDAARSDLFVDSSAEYEIVAAEYLGDGVVPEPRWLQFMREWGPTVVYDSRAELDRIIALLPLMFRYSVENMFDKFPLELYGEEGPTGPKEKNNWFGDERC